MRGVGGGRYLAERGVGIIGTYRTGQNEAETLQREIEERGRQSGDVSAWMLPTPRPLPSSAKP